MHLFDASRRFYGGNAIVAGGLPLAVGLALGDAMLERRRVTACFFGDGATAEGEFHESLNLAALWKLPVLFLCENNQYAMGTALRAPSVGDEHRAQGGRLSDPVGARRRDGRRGRRGGRAARRRARPRGEAGPTSSSSSRTAFVPTRCSIRSSIAIARRSSGGSSGIRSSCFVLAAVADGRSRRRTTSRARARGRARGRRGRRVRRGGHARARRDAAPGRHYAEGGRVMSATSRHADEDRRRRSSWARRPRPRRRASPIATRFARRCARRSRAIRASS